MTKTETALRIELEEQKNLIYKLSKRLDKHHGRIKTEKKRVDRVVQVLLNTLSPRELNKIISFIGNDCQGDFRVWGYSEGHTLKEFLLEIVDP